MEMCLNFAPLLLQKPQEEIYVKLTFLTCIFFFSTKTSSDVQFCMLYILVVTCMYFFQIVWKSRCHILGTFPSHLKRNMFYTEILTQKVELWIVSFRNRAIVQFDKNLGNFFSKVHYLSKIF